MNPDNYQRKMDAEYFAANFKKEHWPADPFETGVLTDATYLDIPDLVAIHKAAKALEAEGNEVFASELVVQKNGSNNYDWRTEVRVNPLYLDRKRQQTAEICELLQAFYWGTCEGFKVKRQEIVDMGDDQLLEFVRQVDEALGLTFQKAKVMEIIE